MHGLSLTIFHASNPDLRKHSKQVKNLLKTETSGVKGLEISIVCEEVELIDYLEEHSGEYDWVIINKNGYRG